MKPLRPALRWLGAVLLPAMLLSAMALLCPAARALAPDKAFSHYVLDHWSIEDGLPQITAIALAQDHAGYLWIGTQGPQPVLNGKATVKRLDFGVGGGDWADTGLIPDAIAVSTKVVLQPAK